ncbi:MAG: transporter substrate-binding domain-containing protein [Sneathiellales bacterium]|nr:transporter substrate-binding domain-containing protein [Sneathiellales bacterium]
MLLKSLTYLKKFALVLGFCLGIPGLSVTQAEEKLEFSSAEQAWIEKHPVIRIGIDGDYAPYSFQRSDGSYAGIAPDFIRVIEVKTGLKFEAVPGLTWPEIMIGARARSLDVIATAFKTKNRENFLDFTEIYINTPLVMMTQIGHEGIQKPADLSGARVALVRDYLSTERVLNDFPSVLPKYVETPLDGLQAVATGEVDAYVGVLGVSTYIARENGLSNLKVAGRYDFEVTGQRFAVRKDWPELTSILDKALADMSVQERNRLISSWVPVLDDAIETSRSAPPFTLDEEEKAWLSENPGIKVGIMKRWPPMNYEDHKGMPRGIGVDYINLINQRLQGAIEIVQDDWSENLLRLEKGEIQALMDITPTPEREKKFLFTSPYVDVPHVIFARKNGPYFKSLDDLKQRSVALEEGFFVEQVLKNRYPEIATRTFKTSSEALGAVLKGEVDAYIGNRAVALYIIRTELMDNLQAQGRLTQTSSVNAFAVNPSHPMLQKILQKTLDSLTAAEHKSITKDWIEEPQRRLQLSETERSWLKANPIIRVAADNSYAPIEYIGKDGQFAGLAMDYLKEVSEILGITFETNPRLDWKTSVDMLSKRELDLFSAATPTANRHEIAKFTSSYINLPQMIFTRDDVPYVNGIAGLKQKKVAVVSGYAITDHLNAGDWSLDLVEVDTVSEALSLLGSRSVDAYIGSILVTGHAIRQEGLTNIRVSGETPFTNGLSMGVRSDWPEFHRILQKTLNSLPDATHQRIMQKWIGLEIKKGLDYALLWKLGLIVVAILLAFLAWNAYLQRRMEFQRKDNERLEQQLRHAQKMDAVGQLTGGIAHDFNNILAIIQGNLELLKESMQDKPDDRTTGRVEAAFIGAKRGAELTRKLLNFSKNETQDTQRIKVNDFIRNLDELISKSLTVAINLQYDLQEDIWEVDANPGDLQDALINLSINARDAMPDGGSLVFESKNKTLGPEHLKFKPDAKPGKYVMIAVTDTGEGMPAEIQEKVFEPFFTTKSSGRGTGLGLSMVYGFVKRSGGFLDIYSEEGEGTVIRMYLPRSRRSRQENEKKDRKIEVVPTGEETILVVDDEKGLVEVAATHLQGLGYKTLLSHSAQDALHHLESGRQIDLLFSDVVMPGGMDGFDLAKKAIELKPDLKILLTSGFSKKQELALTGNETLSVFVKSLLGKPYTKEELALAVRNALDASNTDKENKPEPA